MLAIPSIYVFITKYCLNLKIQIAITSVLYHIWPLVNILMILSYNTTITTGKFCVSILPVWERMWICRALSLPKTFWHRRHLWRKNGSSLTYWDLSTTATGRKGTFNFFITVRAFHGKIIYCFQVSIFCFTPFSAIRYIPSDV